MKSEKSKSLGEVNRWVTKLELCPLLSWEGAEDVKYGIRNSWWVENPTLKEKRAVMQHPRMNGQAGTFMPHPNQLSIF